MRDVFWSTVHVRCEFFRSIAVLFSLFMVLAVHETPSVIADMHVFAGSHAGLPMPMPVTAETVRCHDALKSKT